LTDREVLGLAQEKRRALHAHRLPGTVEALAFVEAVEQGVALPLATLHAHVGPYALLTPGSDNTTDTHQKFYAHHEHVQPLYFALAKRIITDVIREPCYLQAIPTYRFGLPDNRWVGSYHRDSDFGHCEYELNAICALTPMHNSAALHVEQNAGDHDFEPLNLEVGEVILFDHIDRLHGCPLNREEVSVASIDFRFVPQRFSEAAFANAAKSVNTATAFLPGFYFTRESVEPDVS
jgi:hypothetical protein